jgi:hypothetical protein
VLAIAGSEVKARRAARVVPIRKVLRIFQSPMWGRSVTAC